MAKLFAILQNLIYTVYLAELLPLVLALTFVKKIKSSELKVFLVYTIVFSFFFITSLFYQFVLKDPKDQMIVRRIFLVCEFSFLSAFFYHQIRDNLKKWILPFFGALFFALSLYDYITTIDGVFSFIPLVFECAYFILLIVYIFYEKIQFSLHKPLYYSANFWISVGFLLFFSGNFFLFLFSKYYSKNPDFFPYYIVIYGSVTIVKNLLLCIGILVNTYLDEHPTSDNFSIDIDLGTFNPFTKTTNLNIL